MAALGYEPLGNRRADPGLLDGVSRSPLRGWRPVPVSSPSGTVQVPVLLVSPGCARSAATLTGAVAAAGGTGWPLVDTLVQVVPVGRTARVLSVQVVTMAGPGVLVQLELPEHADVLEAVVDAGRFVLTCGPVPNVVDGRITPTPGTMLVPVPPALDELVDGPAVA